MLVAEVRYSCLPGMREKLLAFLPEAVETFRREEGNIAYDQFPDLADDQMVVIEKWESEAAFDKHGKTEAYQAFCARRKPLLKPGSFTITVFNAEENTSITSRLREVLSGSNN